MELHRLGQAKPSTPTSQLWRKTLLKSANSTKLNQPKNLAEKEEHFSLCDKRNPIVPGISHFHRPNTLSHKTLFQTYAIIMKPFQCLDAIQRLKGHTHQKQIGLLSVKISWRKKYLRQTKCQISVSANDAIKLNESVGKTSPHFENFLLKVIGRIFSVMRRQIETRLNWS